MVTRVAVPFNVDLLELTPQKLRGMRPVTKLDIFDGVGGNFSEDGLFSISIFGKVGDERRSTRFSYIDIKVQVFHPIIHRTLINLKRLYGGIIAGTEYALWNPEISDFERADPINGKTGFSYFVEHWENIAFEETKSTSREQNILLLKKYKGARAMTSKIVVMPAGLRDLEVDAIGRIREDEINNVYRKLLSVANTISDASIRNNPELINTARNSLQQTFNELYEIIESMVEGKKKLLMGKWASRRIMNGTRNVITAMDTSTPYLGADGAVDFNNTIIGLYQALKATLPVSIYHIRNGFLSKVFTSPGAPVHLVNKQTLKGEEVHLRPEYFDRWMTVEGVEKVITAFGEESMRHKPLEIEGRYLALIYKGPDGTFKIIRDIDELPEGRSRSDVAPLTFCELLYLSCYQQLNKYPIFVTRYPVTGVGSIYPSKMYIKTTIHGEIRRELGEDWTPTDKSHTAYQFPQAGGSFVNSLVPHPARLDGLGADFDGDTGSGNATYSDESIAEVNHYFTQKRAYVGTDGRLIASANISTVALVMHNLTGD